MPEGFEAFDQAIRAPKGVTFVKVVRAELLVRGGSLQHVVASGQDGTDQRPLGTAQCSQASELRLQETAPADAPAIAASLAVN